MKKLIYSIVTVFVLLSAMSIGGLSFAEESTATLISGPAFNKKVKTLVSGTEVTDVNTPDNTILFIKEADEMDETADYIDVSADGSPKINVWFDDGTLYYYTEADIIYMNNDASSMFRSLLGLVSIDLSAFDTSNVSKMTQMFNGCKSLTSMDLSSFDTRNVTDMQGMFNGCDKLKKIDLSSFDTSKVITMKTMFFDCISLTGLDLSNFDTSSVTNTQSMFAGNNRSMGLTTIYTSDLFDVKDVTDSNSKNMFNFATNLEGGNGTKVSEMGVYDKTYAKIDRQGQLGYFTEKPKPIEESILLPGKEFNAILKSLAAGESVEYSEVNNNIRAIKRAENLLVDDTEISIPGVEKPVYAWFDDENGTIYYYSDSPTIYTNENAVFMFYQMKGLETIELKDIDTSMATNMQAMFNYCSNLKKLDLSNFDTSNVENMISMFHGDETLKTLDLSEFDTSKVETMRSMFNGCSKLKTIYVSENFVTDNLISGEDGSDNMFLNDNKLVGGNGTPYDEEHKTKEYARIDDGPDNPGYFTATPDPIDESILVPGTQFNEILKDIVLEAEGEEGSGVSLIVRAESQDQEGVEVSLPGVVDDKKVYVRYDNSDGNGILYYYSKSPTIYMNEDSSHMFSGLNNLNNLNLSGIDTSRVTNMSSMFAECSSLEELDLSNFNTDKVTNMASMFAGCNSLEELDLSDWDVSNVTDMSSMFDNCQNLTSLDLSDWETSSVGNMAAMFFGCQNLKSLDLSSWDVSKVTDMNLMFSDCQNLESLNLSGWDTSSTINMSLMFAYDGKLRTIYANDSFILTGDHPTSYFMFADTSSIVGGNGTRFDDNYIDGTYAKVDKLGQSGYFTDANNITVRYINENGDELYATGVVRGNVAIELTSGEIVERETGHSLKYYADEGRNTIFDFSHTIVEYTEIYTKWELNQYTITFVDGSGENAEVVYTGDYNSSVNTDYPIWTKDGYTISWDKPIPANMPLNGDTITASWTVKSKPSGGNSGGYSGGGGHSHDNSDHGSAGDEQKENNTQEQETTPTDNQKNETEIQGKDNTQNATHEWSYQNGLTKYINASDARLRDSLTRSEMAKLASIFATKVLGETPDESKQSFCSQFADISKLNGEMRDYVIKACELGYMGYQSNGVDELVNFRPYSPVTVAEASVIVSRMMWGNQNASSGKNWYKGHLYAAYNHGLLDDIRNPYRNITRGEAFEMFYRTSQAK